jgi:hypothetical protein
MIERLKVFQASKRLEIPKWWPLSYIVRPHLPEPTKGTKDAGRCDFDLTHPDDWPQWVKNMSSEGAAVEVLKDGTVLWWGGRVHDGIWMGGYFLGGQWLDGIWLGGDFVEGVWKTGEWRGGNFGQNGIWRDGVFRAGTFSGLWMKGTWLGGTFNGWREKTTTPPTL